jgi:hypothetical protein
MVAQGRSPTQAASLPSPANEGGVFESRVKWHESVRAKMMHLTLQDFTCRREEGRQRRDSSSGAVEGKKKRMRQLRTFERQVRRVRRRVDASVNAEKQEVRRTKEQEEGEKNKNGEKYQQE